LTTNNCGNELQVCLWVASCTQQTAALQRSRCAQ